MEEVYQFDVTTTRVSEWKKHLETEGYVVLLNALSPSDVEHGKELFFRDIPLEEDENGFLSDPKLAHSDFAWFTRTRPNILQSYAEIYGISTDKLITAFDRASMVRNEQAYDDDEDGDYWLHVDNFLFMDKDDTQNTVQSFVSFYDPPRDSNGNGPGLRVVPKKYLSIDEIRKDMDMDVDIEGGFWPIGSDLFSRIKPYIINVRSPAGSLTLWSSDVVHDGNVNMYQQSPLHDELARLVLYTCYTPIDWASKDDLEFRLDAFRNGYTTTHWPCKHLAYHLDDPIDWDYERICRMYPCIQELVPVTKKRRKKNKKK